jgi:thiol-disulfide isomerase/thioredoxin
MTEDDLNSRPATEPSRPGRRGFSRIVVAAIIAAAVLGSVLYAIREPGKETDTQTAAATTCADARKTAERLAPLVHGEIAALSLATQPKPLPELSFAGPDGAKTDLARFRGQLVLLNLWATWCVPCRQEMPALDRLQAKAGTHTFEVVAVNIDTTRLEKPKAFLNEVGVKDLAFYADSSADVFQRLKQAGKVVGLPTTILVGKDGCEIGTLAGPAQWDSDEALALVKAAQG